MVNEGGGTQAVWHEMFKALFSVYVLSLVDRGPEIASADIFVPRKRRGAVWHLSGPSFLPSFSSLSPPSARPSI